MRQVSIWGFTIYCFSNQVYSLGSGDAYVYPLSATLFYKNHNIYHFKQKSQFCKLKYFFVEDKTGLSYIVDTVFIANLTVCIEYQLWSSVIYICWEDWLIINLVIGLSPTLSNYLNQWWPISFEAKMI